MIGLLKELLLEQKTVYRANLNKILSQISISGHTIDLGSKSSDASYYQHLQIDPNTKLTFTDLFPNDEANVLLLDVTKDFPLESNQYDTVLAFNLLEHIPEIDTFIVETFRILKNGGKIIISVPFMYPFHPDPSDYLRFTDEYMKYKFLQVGYHHHKTIFPNLGPVTIFSDFLITAFFPKLLKALTRPLILLLSYLLDRVLFLIRPVYNGRKINEVFAPGFVIIFEKAINEQH